MNLGLTGRYDAFGDLQAAYGPPIGNGGVDVGLVRNLENDAYWFGNTTRRRQQRGLDVLYAIRTPGLEIRPRQSRIRLGCPRR